MPEIALTLMMVLLLLVTADRTLRKGAKAFQKESLQRKVLLKEKLSYISNILNSSCIHLDYETVFHRKIWSSSMCNCCIFHQFCHFTLQTHGLTLIPLVY